MPWFSGGGGGGAGGLSTATTRLTDAQIKALPSGGVTLVAAQGANTIIVPQFVVIRCDTSNDGYTNIAGTATLFVSPDVAGNGITLSYLSEAAAGSHKVSTLLASFDDEFAYMVPALALSGSTPLASVLETAVHNNAGLSLWLPNGVSGNLTGGNAANFMTVETAYTVASVAP